MPRHAVQAGRNEAICQAYVDGAPAADLATQCGLSVGAAYAQRVVRRLMQAG